MKNVVEIACSLRSELCALHAHVERVTRKRGERHEALTAQHARLLKLIFDIDQEIGTCFEGVMALNDSRERKCPDCGHGVGNHPESGEFQEYLGCSYRRKNDVS